MAEKRPQSDGSAAKRAKTVEGNGASIVDKAQQWLKWDSNADDRKQIQELLDKQDHKELEARLGKRIAFGTSGLRAAMKAGWAFMNDLVIQQTSQGLCKYLEDQLGTEELVKRGVVIGFDGRHHSKDFADITARVFLRQGVPVSLLAKSLVCTPIVAFGVKHKKAAVGVMVTASHNPKEDNGYKVYWGNGCQIISPHDKGIAASILKHQEPWADLPALEGHVLVSDPTDSLADVYYAECTKRLAWTRDDNGDNPLRITYTAMHGVGHIWAQRAFVEFGLHPYIGTQEQLHPDAEFPTVKFPNPEEGKGALSLAIKTADAAGSPLILANDPDADRLAVAEKQAGGEWRIFNGNELGIMLASWMWKNYKLNHPKADGKSVAMVGTAVSSQMLAAMAKQEGFQYHETLTGFKWIGNKASDLIASGVRCLFGYEEAIGFMLDDICFDKDGVRAAAVMAEFAGSLYARSSSLSAHLNSLYDLYGFFCIETRYYFCHEREVMAAIFERLRTQGPEGGYMTCCGSHAVTHVRDQTTGYDSSKKDKKSLLPFDPFMMTFTFQNGCVATVRGSGTEPKLKYYVEMCGKPGQDRVEVSALHQDMLKAISEHFLQPKLNGLKAPTK